MNIPTLLCFEEDVFTPEVTDEDVDVVVEDVPFLFFLISDTGQFFYSLFVVSHVYDLASIQSSIERAPLTTVSEGDSEV